MSSDRPPCSVVLPTRDRPDMSARCIASVLASLTSADELIVVDSASVVALDATEGTRLVRLEHPGANRARNAGWRAARHDIVLFVDDDVTVDTGWADAFAAAFDGHPTAGFVTGRIEVPPEQGTVDYPVAIKDDAEAAWLTDTTAGVLGHSASLGLRRTALRDVGGFDEVLGAGGQLPMSDETDLFDRLFAAGWEGWYEPTARAWHDQWRSRRERVRLSWLYGFGAGARIAKLRRTNRPRARQLATEVFWRRGIVDAFADGRHGYKTALLIDVAHLGGAVAGLARAWRMPVIDGHFRLAEGRRRP